MQISLKDDLPFVAVTINYQGQSLTLPAVLVDTGSARTILAADLVAEIQITPAPDDTLYTIRGVGGTEVVFSRHINFIEVGDCRLSNFEIEVGGMDYGFEIQGILGMDFLRQAGAILDLSRMTIEFAD